MANDDLRDDFVVGLGTPLAYVTDGTGAAPFDENGHLLLQPRTDANRDFLVPVRKSATELAIGLRVVSHENDEPDVLLGAADLVTGDTHGFAFLPSVSGVPTGTPESYGHGTAAVVDSTSGTLYFYTGGGWAPVSGSAGTHGNVGAGVGLFRDNAGGSTNLRSLIAGTGITIAIEPSDDEVRITADQGAIDHGSVGGLGDDDHPHYLLASGARDMAGIFQPNGNATRDLGTLTRKFKDFYAQNVHTGDLVMHDPKCVTCGGEFVKGDALMLEVIAVEGPKNDRALRTVPVHNHCRRA